MKRREYVRKAFLQNLGILLGSALVFFLAAEGVLRLFDPEALSAHRRFPQGMYCRPDPLAKLHWSEVVAGIGVPVTDLSCFGTHSGREESKS